MSRKAGKCVKRILVVNLYVVILYERDEDDIAVSFILGRRKTNVRIYSSPIPINHPLTRVLSQAFLSKQPILQHLQVKNNMSILKCFADGILKPKLYLPWRKLGCQNLGTKFGVCPIPTKKNHINLTSQSGVQTYRTNMFRLGTIINPHTKQLKGNFLKAKSEPYTHLASMLDWLQVQ